MEASRGCQASSTTACLFLRGSISLWPGTCVFSASWKAVSPSYPPVSTLVRVEVTSMCMPPSCYISTKTQTPVLTIAQQVDLITEPPLQRMLVNLNMFDFLQWAIVFFFKQKISNYAYAFTYLYTHPQAKWDRVKILGALLFFLKFPVEKQKSCSDTCGRPIHGFMGSIIRQY